MAAPLDPNVPANGDSPFFGAAEIRALKQFLIDVWGIPPAPGQITTPIGSTSTGGVFSPSSGFILPDVVPSVLGQLGRSGASAQFNNGLLAGSLSLVIDKSNNAITVVNTTAPVTVYLGGIAPNLLGTAGRLRFTAIGRVSIRALHILSISIAWAGVSTLVTLPLVGGITTDRNSLALRVDAEILMNGRVYFSTGLHGGQGHAGRGGERCASMGCARGGKCCGQSNRFFR